MRLFYAHGGQNADVYRLLALAVEGEYAIPCPEVVKDAYGKPYFPSRPDIHFSLSHTRGLLMVAVDSAPCGCDVEHQRPVRQGVAERVCSPEELEQFSFLELWTLKESYYKLLGHTKKPFRELVFRRDGGKIIPPDPRLYARLYPLGPYLLAAISRISPPPEIKCLHL